MEGRGDRDGDDLTDDRHALLVLLQVVLVHEHAHELLHEQRVPVGAGEHPLGKVAGHARVTHQVADESPALGAAQRLEVHAGGAGEAAGKVRA